MVVAVKGCTDDNFRIRRGEHTLMSSFTSLCSLVQEWWRGKDEDDILEDTVLQCPDFGYDITKKLEDFCRSFDMYCSPKTISEDVWLSFYEWRVEHRDIVMSLISKNESGKICWHPKIPRYIRDELPQLEKKKMI